MWPDVDMADVEMLRAEGTSELGGGDDAATTGENSVDSEGISAPWCPDEWDEEREATAFARLEANARRVPAFWVEKYKKDAQRYWDIFYKEHETRFFKDRHYLQRDFAPELAPALHRPVFLMEFGCGVGNALFPLVHRLPHLYVCGFDLSSRAISLACANELVESTDRVHLFVFDGTVGALPAFADPRAPADKVARMDRGELPRPSSPWLHGRVALQNGFDLALMLFMLSAVAPDQMASSFRTAASVLRPGGMVRDLLSWDLFRNR